MKRLWLIVAAIGCMCGNPAFAQTNGHAIIPTGECGTSSTLYSTGQYPVYDFMDIYGNTCVYNAGGGGGGGGSTTPSAVTPTDRGGTITTGGTAQTLAAANASRKILVVQNPCTAAGEGIGTAEDLFISVTGTATVNGAADYADLAPCGSATISFNGTVIQTAVSVIAATTGHRWDSTEGQ